MLPKWSPKARSRWSERWPLPCCCSTALRLFVPQCPLREHATSRLLLNSPIPPQRWWDSARETPPPGWCHGENRTLGSSVKRCRDICRGGCSNRVTGHREVGRGCARRHGHASRNGCCCGVVARQSHGPLCRSARRGSIQRHFAGGIGEPARNAGRIQSNRGHLCRSEFATLVLHAKRRSIP